jgi:pimeloyl-ACP methyl ester carboxylesterase
VLEIRPAHHVSIRQPIVKKNLIEAIFVLGAVFAAGLFRYVLHAQQAPPLPTGEVRWIVAHGLRLKTKIYRSQSRSEHPRMIVILHGDSPFRPPSYQYLFAHQVAFQIDNVMAVAILRPGYSDDSGQKSTGERGETTGDNYTPEVVDAIAEAVNQLKAKFQPEATILVGHSGGAAISANILGKWPAAANGALLVSCPCDLPAWRKHMLVLQKAPIWLAPVKSLSPMDYAGKVATTTHVRMVIGSEDPIAPPKFTQEYADALRKNKVPVDVTIGPGMKHDILLEPIVLGQLKILLQTVEEAAQASRPSQ